MPTGNTKHKKTLNTKNSSQTAKIADVKDSKTKNGEDIKMGDKRLKDNVANTKQVILEQSGTIPKDVEEILTANEALENKADTMATKAELPPRTEDEVREDLQEIRRGAEALAKIKELKIQNKNLTGPSPKEEITPVAVVKPAEEVKPVEEVKPQEIIDATKAEIIAEGTATVEEVNEASKTEEVKATAENVAEVINQEVDPDDELIKKFQEDNKSGKPAAEVVSPSRQKRELVAKAWQKISGDGNNLVNIITFLGTKVDYAVGMKNKYKFPNLSISDGLNRIVTAKFPKEDMKPLSESIEFKGYVLDIDKFGNSAVCTLHDPDGRCILEFVSLATVIDVLQDALNPDAECLISWGTIDQIIKHKRGLKSRIKNLGDNDEPVRQRGGVKPVEEVDSAETVKIEGVAEPVPQELVEATK